MHVHQVACIIKYSASYACKATMSHSQGFCL